MSIRQIHESSAQERDLLRDKLGSYQVLESLRDLENV